MSVSIFQPKLWNDRWDDLILDSGKWNTLTGEVVDPEEWAPPARTVWAQVDEIEIWPDNPGGGMTRGMVREIEKRYLDHKGRIIVLGDASGNQRRSSSTTTDWQIIGESMRKFINPMILRGLIANQNLKEGRTMYSNPAQRDALQNANRMLMDATGKMHVCFLPDSPLASGGVAGALTGLGFKADGGFDTRNERKMDRDIARSHFADTYKYFAWWALPPASFSADRNDGTYSAGLNSAEDRRRERDEFNERTGWIF